MLSHSYTSDQVLRWKGYRLIAVDGFAAQLPNREQIQARYGVFKYRDDGKAICLGRTPERLRPLNHLTLHGSLDSEQVSEQSMLWDWLPKERKGGRIFFCDRAFISGDRAGIWRRMLRCTAPIRKGRKFKHNHQRKRKHYMHYKPI